MKRVLWIIIVAVVVLAVLAGVFVYKSNKTKTITIPDSNATQSEKDSAAVKAGKGLSNNNCTGSGSRELTRLPMNETDYSIILPYGLMVDGHVTPIDHQYFSPIVFNSPRDTYPVYAMADAKIVDIQPRTNERGTEYRFVFSMSCTFLYYYDLVTSLAPDIKTHFDKHDFNFTVTAGQEVGKIGGQTLDFAVWDTTKPLKNFINPTSYLGEAWKIYTADPLDYYSPDAKAKALAKYVRTVAPLSGRIDYDIDGKLIGNWFVKDSGGYAGPGNGVKGYWAGHLAIVPEYLDNSSTIVSFGSWAGGDAKQWTVKNPIDPATIGIEMGLVKYEVYGYQEVKSNGSRWDSMSLYHDPKVALNSNDLGGCVLLQLTEARALKVEQFPGKKCADVSAFTTAAKTYER
jgi:hypothetical protein